MKAWDLSASSCQNGPLVLVSHGGQACQTFERHFHLDRLPTACIFLSRGMLEGSGRTVPIFIRTVPTHVLDFWPIFISGWTSILQGFTVEGIIGGPTKSMIL